MLQGPPPYPDDLLAVLSKAKELSNWIARRHDDQEIPKLLRSLIPGLLFDLSIEHHVAIVGLVDHHVNGSAFALLRATFEAFVRGIWLQLCASDEDIQVFYKRDCLPKELHFGRMIEAVEKHPDFSDKLLSQIQRSSWKAINSYTHGGMLQLSRRINGGIIEPNFDPDEIVELLRASGLFALLALQQIARLSKNETVTAEVAALLVGTELSLNS